MINRGDFKREETIDLENKVMHINWTKSD